MPRPPVPVPFDAHLGLLELFLARRDEIVERAQALLNARRKPDASLQDAALLSGLFEDCFFTIAGVTQSQSRLRGQLEAAHRASGFTPRQLPGLHNRLADPAEMIVRGVHLWRQTRWPGRTGRVRYAHTLFNLSVIRSLALLSMRVWDAGPGGAGERLSQVQRVLDRLWSLAPADQPVLVRDARWLIPLAQSPATDDLGAYFDVAACVAESLPDEDRLEVHAAGVRMTAGHLRSQTRYYARKMGVPLTDTSLLVSTRSSNALDFALLIHELVPLLEAYERACGAGDGGKRRALADTICQGVSPDPELFLNRVELLGAYSMIEPLFVATDGRGDAVYTPLGARHVRLLREYGVRIGRVATRLHEDCPQFRPVAGAYSPYGLLYGFSSDLLEHMVLGSLRPDAVTRLGLEDAFAGDDTGTEKLAWVNGWRTLPHVAREVQKLFEYPQQFAEDVFARLERALRTRVSGVGADAFVQTGRLCVLSGDRPQADARVSMIPELPARYIESSDRELVDAHKARPCEESHLLRERREGRYVLSCRTPGGWMAITKSFLTEVLEAGRPATIAGLPPAAAGVLTLTCVGLLAGHPVPDPPDGPSTRARESGPPG